jgi:hypothetical protein
MTDREAMTMALEALEWHVSQTRPIQKTTETIEALRQALAQPDKPLRLSPVYEYGHIHDASQPEQEPVAWEKSYDIARALLRQAHDILATTQYPIKRPWVGLTDETLDDVYFCVEGGTTPLETWREQARAIEAKLKEKNGG